MALNDDILIYKNSGPNRLAKNNRQHSALKDSDSIQGAMAIHLPHIPLYKIK